MSKTDRGRAGHAALSALAATLLLALIACSAPAPPRFHSLTPAAADTAPVSKAAAAAGAVAWDVLPVSVPPGIDQPQWVVRSTDGSLVVLEQERWIGSLADEIRAAVMARLTQTLGPPAVRPDATWQVRIDVLRLETAPGREARIEAVWSLLPPALSTAAALRCHGAFVESTGVDGYLALAAAHRRAVVQMSDRIAAGLAAASSGQQAVCGVG